MPARAILTSIMIALLAAGGAAAPNVAGKLARFARGRSGRLTVPVVATGAAVYRSIYADAAAAAAGGADAAGVPLHFAAELTYLPSPDKVVKGSPGEDAYFVSRYAVGVADGVGGWADVGVDAGEYSRRLMAGTQSWVDAAASSGSTPVDLDPLVALSHGYAATTVRGSSTACVATVGHDGRLRVLNLGDSGLMVWRHERQLTLLPPPKLRLDEAAKLWSPLLRTTEQQHYFNCPYQLEHGGDDLPTKGQAVSFAARPGDLVLLGTDGLFDNLAETDIRAALAKVDFTPCHTFIRAAKRRHADAAEAAAGTPAFSLNKVVGGTTDAHSPAAMRALEKDCRAVLLTVSASLAVGAQRVGLDPTAKSPFSIGARKAGLRHSGGKLDDVVVVAALVVPDEAAVRRGR